MKDEINNEDFTMTDEKKPGEMQEKALNNVAGGDWNASSAFYRSGYKPVYEVG